MGLNAEQIADVTSILDEHPDWTTSQVRAEAGLSPRDLFAVKRLRTSLGIPEPGGGNASGGGKRPTRKGKGAAPASADLEEGGDTPTTQPTGPKRAGGGKRPTSILAPILPTLAQSLMVGVMAATNNMTRGKAPMTVDQAKAVAVPSLRIVDRTVSKYVKKSGKITPNQEDAGMIALALMGWLIGWIVASVSGAKAAPAPSASAPRPPETDLFGGSEPTGPRPVASQQAAAPAASPAPIEDETDLFAGSEPLSAGAGHIQPAGPSAGPRRMPNGPNLPPTSEAVWQAVMPTDVGEGYVA